MRVSQYILVISLTVLCIVSCKKDETSPVRVPTTGTIQGRVTNLTGDTAIAGCNITSLPPSSAVTSNAQGTYTIPNVSPGQYAIYVSKGGYNQGSVNISVSAGQTTTADIQLSTVGQNAAPNPPTLVFPAPASVNQPTTLTLRWNCTDPDSDPLTYDVYFGSASTPTTLISSNQSASSLVRVDLDTSVTWYWRVVAKDNRHATTIGDIWSFRTTSPRVTNMLYLHAGDPATWIIPGGERSQYAEIQRWVSASFSVTTRNLTTTIITDNLLRNYQVLRLTCPEGGSIGRSISSSEANAIYSWVGSGGRFFAEVNANSHVPFVSPFGIDRIDGQAGGASGLSWYYHGAPYTLGPISGPDSTVAQMACEVMDRPVLQSGNSLTIAGTIDGYPAIVHGSFGSGKLVVTFIGGWSWDATSPGNAYRANIFLSGNLQFLGNVIRYLSR